MLILLILRKILRKNERMQELENFAQEYTFCINKDLSQIQRFELLELLQEFKDVFARSLFEIKQYPHYELELDLLSKQRAFRRQFRLHPDHAKIAQNQIDEMVAAKIIEPR